jgi:hypothetical protein
MVYEHLFLPDSFQPGGYHLESSIPPFFATPEIVGDDFCHEVIQWYYEHGCAGHGIALYDLKAFLSRNMYGLGLTPTTCNMRSLAVKINGLRTPSPTPSISSQLAPLLALDLKKDFHLTLTISITFQDEISVKYLVSLLPSIKSTIEAFRTKDCVVDFAFVFQQELMREIVVGDPSASSYMTHRLEAQIRRYAAPLPLRDRPLFAHRVEGGLAESMLELNGKMWVVYLKIMKGAAGAVFRCSGL